jgi:ribonuclease-3
MTDLAALQARLGYRFHDESRLRLALTHPSLANEQPEPEPHNQRLEFLGDAVLGLVLARVLYDQFPGADEGALSKSRARLVNAEALAQRARAVELGRHLVVSPGAERTGERERVSALADAFEAVLGAVFLDGGLAEAEALVRREFAAELAGLTPGASEIGNPKGELQEKLQATSTEVPHYELLRASGPDHDREFECAVIHGGVELGRGRGRSKKAAETEAALAALEFLRGKPGSGPAPAGGH